MPDIKAEVAGKLVTPLGYDGTDFQNLKVDAADGHLQVDVLTSGLPAGAATSANQATILTRLSQIRDLEDSGQLYHEAHVMVGAGDYILDGHTVAPDTVFVLTVLAAYNGNGATGSIWLGARLAGLNRWFKYQAGIAAGVVVFWSGRLYCQEDTIIRSLFAGVNNGNLLMFDYSGYTLEI